MQDKTKANTIIGPLALSGETNGAQTVIRRYIDNASEHFREVRLLSNSQSSDISLSQKIGTQYNFWRSIQYTWSLRSSLSHLWWQGVFNEKKLVTIPYFMFLISDLWCSFPLRSSMDIWWSTHLDCSCTIWWCPSNLLCYDTAIIYLLLRAISCIFAFLSQWLLSASQCVFLDCQGGIEGHGKACLTVCFINIILIYIFTLGVYPVE